MNADAASETRQAYLSKYDSPTSGPLNRVWGGCRHMGLLKDGRNPLANAHMQANLCMAEAAALRPAAKVLEVACGSVGK